MNDDSIFSYYVAIDPDDFRRIAELLRSRNVFTPILLAPEVDCAADGTGGARSCARPDSSLRSRESTPASAAHQQPLADAQFTASMSRVGDCWDNAVVESFFATLRKELLAAGLFESRVIANRELFTFIEIWHNRQRRHSSLGYRSPAQFEAELERVSKNQVSTKAG